MGLLYLNLYLTNAIYIYIVGRDSSVGLATRFGLDGPEIESRPGGGGEIFRNHTDWLWGPPSLVCNGYRVFPGGKSRRGVVLTNHHYLVLRIMQEYSYASTKTLGLPGLF
jgi:hypothetical protein